MRKWLLTFYDQKNSGAYTQYLLCGFHFSISSVCKYWAPFLGNGILPTYIFRSCNKMSDVYDQYLLCRLRFSICSPGIYWAPSREVQEGAPYLGNGILAPYIFRSYDIKFQKSNIDICFVVCVLVFAPQVYIELPLGSSRRELHFWAMGFGLLFHLGALKKNFRTPWYILALSFTFYYVPYVP